MQHVAGRAFRCTSGVVNRCQMGIRIASIMQVPYTRHACSETAEDIGMYLRATFGIEAIGKVTRANVFYSTALIIVRDELQVSYHICVGCNHLGRTARLQWCVETYHTSDYIPVRMRHHCYNNDIKVMTVALVHCIDSTNAAQHQRLLTFQ